MIDPGLQDRVALITGANNPHGIGAGIARALAAQGALVFLHGYREAWKGGRQNVLKKAPETEDELTPGEAFYKRQGRKPLSHVLRSIRQTSEEVAGMEGDLSQPDFIPALFSRAEEAFGHGM